MLATITLEVDQKILGRILDNPPTALFLHAFYSAENKYYIAGQVRILDYKGPQALEESDKK